MRPQQSQLLKRSIRTFCSSCRCQQWISPSIFTNDNKKLYTGRFKYLKNLKVYQNASAQLKKIDRKKNIKKVDDTLKHSDAHAIVGKHCSKLRYKAGDFVEIRNRDGSIVIGLVSNDEPQQDSDLISALNKIKVSTLNEHLAEVVDVDKRNVAFVLRGVFPSASENSKNLLKMLINDALSLANKMNAYWRVSYAQLARQSTIQALDINLLIEKAFKATRESSRYNAKLGVKLLAGYIGLTNNEPSFFSREGNNTPLFAKSEIAVEGEEELGDRNVPAFLRHYTAFPNSTDEQLVCEVLNKDEVGPDNVYDEYVSKDKPRHSLMFPGSITWEDKRGKLIDDLETAIGKSLMVKKKSKDAVIRKKIDKRVYVFQPFGDIALSIEDSSKSTAPARDDTYKLEIHIPDLSHITSESIGLMNQLILRNKSIRIDGKLKSLIPEKLQTQVTFLKNTHRYKHAITVSVHINKRDPTIWQMDNIEFTKIKISKIYDPDQVELALGWKYRTVGDQVFNEADFFQQNEFLDLEGDEMAELMILREVLDQLHFKRIQQPFTAYSYTPPHASTFDLPVGNLEAETIDRMVREARIVAGQVTALFATRNSIVLPFITQPANTSTFENLSSNPKTQQLICEAAGLGNEEILARVGAHYGLGALTGYVSVAFPFDNILDLYSQWRLRESIGRVSLLYPEKKPHFGAAAAVEEKDAEEQEEDKDENNSTNALIDVFHLGRRRKRASTMEIINSTKAQAELIDWYTKRVRNFNFQTQLQKYLKNEKYFIFRCTILQTTNYPQLAAAYCEELDTTVEVALNSATDHVNAGDRIVCNQILEQKPIENLFVLSI